VEDKLDKIRIEWKLLKNSQLKYKNEQQVWSNNENEGMWNFYWMLYA
jgi:hypothetical protein